MATQTTLPRERESVTRKLLLGALEGYVIVGLYPNGQPGEVFLHFHGAGTLERGLLSSLAITISIALQHGVPLAKLVEHLLGMRFEPFGFTTNPCIPQVRSIVDYIARWLAFRFLPEEKLQELHLTQENKKCLDPSQSS